MSIDQVDLGPDDVFFFMHVPKTAGTSLTSVLLPHFDSTWTWRSHEATSLMNVSDLGRYQYVGGHFPYAMVAAIVDRPAVNVTILRDPVRRYRSNHEHLRRVPSRGNVAEVSGARLTIRELLADENRAISKRYRNRQAAFLACELEGTPYEMCRAFERYIAAGPEIDVEAARGRLATFDWVGISERFEQSLQLLSFKFGWRPVAQVPRRNVAPVEAAEHDEWLAQRLAEENDVDLMLYRWALDRFDREYAEMLATISSIAGRSLLPDDSAGITDALEVHYRDRASRRVKPRNRVHFTFDRAVHAAGWHSAESLNGIPYRWTGPGDVAELDLALLAGEDYHLECLVPVSYSEAMTASLRIQCNGEELAIVRRTREGFTRLGATIPAHALDAGCPLIRLTFQTAPPESVPGDDRRLGVSLGWILIWPLKDHGQIDVEAHANVGWRG